MEEFLPKSEVTAKVGRDAVTATVNWKISKPGIIDLPDEAVKGTIHFGGVTGIQDGVVRATIREGRLEVISFRAFTIILM